MQLNIPVTLNDIMMIEDPINRSHGYTFLLKEVIAATAIDSTETLVVLSSYRNNITPSHHFQFGEPPKDTQIFVASACDIVQNAPQDSFAQHAAAHFMMNEVIHWAGDKYALPPIQTILNYCDKESDAYHLAMSDWLQRQDENGRALNTLNDFVEDCQVVWGKAKKTLDPVANIIQTEFHEIKAVFKDIFTMPPPYNKPLHDDDPYRL